MLTMTQTTDQEPEKKEKEVKPKKTDQVKLYFNSDTQRAIVEFQSSFDKKEKDKLYVQEIMPAFEKLVENLINIHKFAGLYDSYDDLKNDCVNFLFETIGKFDAARGTNAFSYFNVVAKNWLIIKTKQKSQKTKKNVSLDDPNMLSAYERNIVEEHCTLPSQDIFLEGLKSTETITAILYEIREKARTENELMCINSIITIFESIDEIDLLNKNAILLYMRELSGLSPKQLTTTMQSIKKHYKKIKTEQKDSND
jgi:hypothetical protein